MSDFTNGYDDGYVKGHTEGYEDGYIDAAQTYEPRLSQMWVELQTLNARVDYLNTLLEKAEKDGNY